MLERVIKPPVRELAAVALLVACASSACGADATAGARAPVPRKSREELVREWDLNSDGKIDHGEAEVAASRMRRERAELRLNSGIDPLTGRPRDEAADPTAIDEAAATDDVAEDATVDDEAAAEADRDEAGLPGTRVPRPKFPGMGAAPTKPEPDAARTPGAGTRAAADLKRQPLTGGARAGGLPARPGYGAGIPLSPLNAGLPIQPRTAAAPTPRPRGGLVPAVRPATPAPPRPAPSRDLYDPY